MGIQQRKKGLVNIDSERSYSPSTQREWLWALNKGKGVSEHRQ